MGIAFAHFLAHFLADLVGGLGLHMQQLVEAGLTTREQRGRWAYYRVVEDTLVSLSAALKP